MSEEAMTITRQYRQGHVLVQPVSAIPPDAVAVAPKRPGVVVIAEGESGREHHFKGDRVSLFQSHGDLYFSVSELNDADGEPIPVVLDHPEHGPIELYPGDYLVIEQREADPITRAVRDSFD